MAKPELEPALVQAGAPKYHNSRRHLSQPDAAARHYERLEPPKQAEKPLAMPGVGAVGGHLDLDSDGELLLTNSVGP